MVKRIHKMLFKIQSFFLTININIRWILYIILALLPCSFLIGYRLRIIHVFIVGILLFIWAWKTKYLFSKQFLTFVAILVALFNQHIYNYIYTPFITVEFDKNSDRCVRTGASDNDSILEFSKNLGISHIQRQYFRLKIANTGLGTAKRVKAIVELFNSDKKEEERFEPNCLRWIGAEKSFKVKGIEKTDREVEQEIEKEVDIASGETTYVYLLSHITKILPPDDKIEVPSDFFVIRLELFNMITPRGISWDKDKRTYYIKVIVYGDNIIAKTYWFKYVPDKKDMFKPGELIRIRQRG